ncbi:hypothetical protein FOPE_05519 [Fonsecaea pedrosoi]|nr:hypothetical protein FOPE_05519 [Fonsecaea pedrosoi]
MSMHLVRSSASSLTGTLVGWPAQFSKEGPAYRGSILDSAGEEVAVGMSIKRQGLRVFIKAYPAVELAGFELQVADAATKAGFNTFNHEALFNLIWAVKRLALQAGTFHSSRSRLLNDPIYPDRYRPRDVDGNAKGKRSAVTIQTPANHTVELKFHPVQPLMRKRPLQDIKEENVIDLTFSDDELEGADSQNTTFKRQKIVNRSNFRLGFPTAIHRKTMPFTSVGMSSKPPSKPARKRANNLARDSAAASFPILPKAVLPAQDEICKQLLLVKAKLDDARRSMNACQGTMKALFDVHYERFDEDRMMDALQKLSGYMNKVYDGSKDGAEEAEKAIGLLRGREG